MRKLFFTIYFMALLLGSGNAVAKVKEVADTQNAAAAQETIPVPQVTSRLEGINSQEEFDDYIRERLRSALITSFDPSSGSYGESATSVVEDKIPDPDEGKSIFEKIYEDAINRVTTTDQNSPTQRQVPIQPRVNNYQWAHQPDVDTISILLPPYDQKTEVPAMEHIPYLFDRIEVLPDGLVKIDETVMVIANGEKLRFPLSKVLPEYFTNRKGEEQKLRVNLIGVDINGQEVAYKTVFRGGNIVLMPENMVPLEPGVYKYQFRFVIDRLIGYYNDFDELYWDVTGNTWNLVVAKAGASVILPPNGRPLSLQGFTGYPFHYSKENMLISQEAKNISGFVTKAPLFIAEGMPLFVSIPKGVVAEPDFSKRLDWLVSDYGEILFAFIGLIFILGAYATSWRYIQKYHKKQNINLRKTPQMLRFLAYGDYDKVSFGAFLLDLFRKNILDIQKSGSSVMLIKRTDNTKSLNRNEQSAMKSLFGKDESVIAATDANAAKFRKASRFMAQDLKEKFYWFSFKLNAGYLLFSIGMLILAEYFMASLHLNSGEVFTALILTTICFAIYLFVWCINWKNKWLNLGMKMAAALMTFLTWVVLSALINPWAGLLILASCIIIKYFTAKYTQRSGLMQANIAEALNFGKYLRENSENISLGREFINQQANILALDAVDSYPPQPSLKNYYRLDLMPEILRLL